MRPAPPPTRPCGPKSPTGPAAPRRPGPPSPRSSPRPSPRAGRARRAALVAAALAGALRGGDALGQAEPAPPGSVPSAEAPRPEPPPPRVRVAGDLRFAGLFGEAAQAAAPLGWGFGLQLSASLLPLGPLRLGFVLDFAQDRFSRTLAAYPEQPQLLLHNTFAAQALLDMPTRYVRPYLAAGAGLSAARHESPLPDPDRQMPQTLDLGTLPLVRVSAGVGFSPLRWLEIGVSGELSFTFSDQRGGVLDGGGAGGDALRAQALLFSPGWGSLATWLGYRFY